MRVLFRFPVFILALLVVLAGCNPASSNLLAKLDIPNAGYEHHFAPIESAVLYVDGITQEIAADDPRLIRVINFLAYAAETMQYSQIQGYVYEDQISQYYSSNVTMLEVIFAVDAVSNHSIHKDTPKILISGDSYLLFVDCETMNDGIVEVHAERHWPYVELAPDDARQSTYDLSWGGDYWLDILQYCGF